MNLFKSKVFKLYIPALKSTSKWLCGSAIADLMRERKVARSSPVVISFVDKILSKF